jgi:hypothetical protein
MTKIHIPSFPDNVPTAPLLRISLSKLLARDEDEEQRLWRAACELGFFYLDLRKSSESNSVQGTVDGDAMLEEVEGLFDLGRGVLGLDEGEKKKFDYAATGSYFGYVVFIFLFRICCSWQLRIETRDTHQEIMF